MNEELEEVRRIISEADPKSVVFFGGAGVSTESGIPDFRSAKGIFNEAYPYPPEVIVSLVLQSASRCLLRFLQSKDGA